MASDVYIRPGFERMRERTPCTPISTPPFPLPPPSYLNPCTGNRSGARFYSSRQFAAKRASVKKEHSRSQFKEAHTKAFMVIVAVGVLHRNMKKRGSRKIRNAYVRAWPRYENIFAAGYDKESPVTSTTCSSSKLTYPPTDSTLIQQSICWCYP